MLGAARYDAHLARGQRHRAVPEFDGHPASITMKTSPVSWCACRTNSPWMRASLNRTSSMPTTARGDQ
ncbi:hypothetical protein QF205_12725 [Luteimonas composti]|uniref:Uncharacterized protein n=1 Tax=Luteimonas composti TaxID=398257 RepID=A0ABT6MTL4_9GAMM|nr:hypothetical protein [Luteimonas composti]MDH7453923.1 hypothetical protein [Luteimonas composti]